ncbi:hypothetical protein GQ600_16483 [Phytophthora cactorum]|nr:hypothetical protein GQ600_16483 [Phytophthora cactorum]
MTLAAEYTHSATTISPTKTPDQTKTCVFRATLNRTTRSIYVTTAQVPYHNLLEEIGETREKESTAAKDGDNCGLFICLFYWRRVFKEAGKITPKVGFFVALDLLRIVVDFSDSNKSVGEETA